MRVLYLSNIEVPYRSRFFDELSKNCDLNVLYERKFSSNRNKEWANSVKGNYRKMYPDGYKIGRESSFSLKIFNHIKAGWDLVVVGCYNSKIQMLAILYMRYNKIPFIINLDGEPFIGHGIKSIAKKFFLKGANAYLVAGRHSADSLKQVLGNKVPIVPYYFSSMDDNEIKENGKLDYKRNKTVLVIGQYFPYKGMDIAFKVACKDLSIKYKFIGMGLRTSNFLNDFKSIPPNVEIIPFLQIDDLKKEYMTCSMLLLPTRQECWGLVVNEAASFGMPIVSTWGSGAANEFLGKKYSKYLTEPEDVNALYDCVKKCLYSNNENYSNYLKEMSRNYTIEKMVQCHINLFCKILGK